MRHAKQVLILGCSLVLLACSTVQWPESGWDNIVYQGFDGEVKALELAGSVDCGFYDLSFQPEKVRNLMLEKQFSCVKLARERNQPYKFGHTWVPLDSRLTLVVVEREGYIHVTNVDLYLDGSGGDVLNQSCQSIALDMNSLSVKSQGCSELPPKP